MGRIFTAFLFIIIPFVKLFADTDASACDINSACSCFTDSSTCSSAPGCYYFSGDEFDPAGCKPCDSGDSSSAGRYGPGCESQCDSITDSSNSSTTISGFRFGHRYYDDQNNAVRGARTKYECYKKLDTANGNTPLQGHDFKCRNSADSEVDGCREYYRDNDAGTTDSTTGLAYQGEADNHFVTCNINDVGLLGEDPSGYHMESNNGKCYSNTRNCSLFGIDSSGVNQCITSDPSHQNLTISSDAVLTWSVDSKEWDASLSCKCRVEGDFEEDHCNGFQEFSNTGMVNSRTVSAQLIFRNNSSFGATTHCSGCLAGSYAGGDNGSYSCVHAQPGYYSKGCGTKWTDDNPLYSGTDTISCSGSVLKPCYAGMTSNSGATSVHECFYTNQTKFCDAWGCTSYSSLLTVTGSDENDWWWYMQESSGSSGSVIDSSNDDSPIEVISVY